ncbi:MAG: MarR family winged helix-turn-helix transcriptional regulator [Bacteroides sp.]|nr:MarR family winged helix-turn-helix transcriptional regulator [Bacillota bacterium]MCM1393797.1 MarR family winged helix-turn-helix transcriptional regulator [[Eubacterium] siraeum]MCM1455116.1 MarR family winged helix-turn-helix transcriptional regulator [Bacteroides sp.]
MDIKQCKNMFTSFRTLLRAYNDYVTGCVREYELSPNEVAVLGGLQTVSTASAIARDADVSKALVSRSVKSLKSKGLIEVCISAVDKREQDLTLTDKGREVAGLIEEANERFYRIATQNTEDRALEITELMLEVIIKNLNVIGGGGIDDDR